MEDITSREWRLVFSCLLEMGGVDDLARYPGMVLSQVRTLIPFDAGNFFIYSFRNESDDGQYRIRKLPVLDIPGDVVRDYLTYYQHLDTMKERFFNQKRPARSSDLIDYREWTETEYYNDFLRPNRFHYLLGVDIHHGNRLLGTITLLRGGGGRDFGTRDILYLDLLRPHIGNQLFKLLHIDARDGEADGRAERIRLLSTRCGLSPRETEVLEKLLWGCTNRELADALYISVNTVKKHIHHIFLKTGATNRTELVSLLTR